MVSTRRKRDDGGSPNEDPTTTDDNVTGGRSTYEEFRNQRIKENKERLQNLGVFDLSLKLKSQLPKTTKTSRSISTGEKPVKSLPPSDSARRSSRLKSVNPVNYSNFFVKAKKGGKGPSKDLEIQIKEGSEPEIYDERHKKLLGDCKTTWTLSVDGHGENGKRIYDQDKGETCHQCRQKTLGLRTHCSSCKLVQGQFCGDCLYTRYGENVNEVNENANWICPVCRGICNCSICRKAQGWEPTGQIYKKVLHLGFKSVAHYLIQTRQGKTQPEDIVVEISDSSNKGPQHDHQDEVPNLKVDRIEAKMEGKEQEVLLLCN